MLLVLAPPVNQSVTLANSGVSAGTTSGITVDAKGRITAITGLAASDIPSLTAAKISDFDTTVQANRLDEMAAPTGAVDFNSQRITSVSAILLVLKTLQPSLTSMP